jgi:hypothetical protein
MPRKSSRWNGSSFASAASRASGRFGQDHLLHDRQPLCCMNMCSVRHRPMPVAPSSRALRASSGVSAFAPHHQAA